MAKVVDIFYRHIHSSKNTPATPNASQIIRRFSRRYHKGHSTLDALPYDIVLEIFYHLGIQGVLSMAQVSRFFHEVSGALLIWQHYAQHFMSRARRLALKNHFLPTDLSAKELRHSVLVAYFAERNWISDKPKHVAPPKVVKLRDMQLDQFSYVMKFSSGRHLVLPTGDGKLVGWDMKKNNCVGRFDMGSNALLINVQCEYMTRSLFWIVGKVSNLDAEETYIDLSILRIQFPDPESAAKITFEFLAEMSMPWSLASELHFLDASRQMFCAVFQCPRSGNTGINVVFDWKTGISTKFDTGLPYIYGRTVIGVNISSDGRSLVLHSDENGTEVRRYYSIESLRERASVWHPSLSLTSACPTILPDRVASSHWCLEPASFYNGDFVPHTVWVLPQWWPTYNGLPVRTSTIILYLSVTDSGDKTWRAAQHYSKASGAEGEGQAGPCSNSRCVIDICNPVLIPLGQYGLPILAQSFNHIGWIEERDIKVNSLKNIGRRVIRHISGKSVKKRTLKLVTFPDPGTGPSSCACSITDADKRPTPFAKAVTLDVPEKVLNDAYHMFLDPAAGTITIATVSNALHVFRYG